MPDDRISPHEWVRNMTGESILFSPFGWFIVMQRDDGRWYWSHQGRPHGYYDNQAEAQAAADAALCDRYKPENGE